MNVLAFIDKARAKTNSMPSTTSNEMAIRLGRMEVLVELAEEFNKTNEN